MAFLFRILVLLILSVTFCSAQAEAVPRGKAGKNNVKAKTSKIATSTPFLTKYRGWEYLVNKLSADGIGASTLSAIYSDKRMPAFTDVYFKLAPKEPSSIYSRFQNETQIKLAKDFISKNQDIFDEAEKKFKVNRYIIASIMLVETHFGKNVGNDLVINRLSRVASIAKPENIKINFDKLNKEDPSVTYAEVEERAHYLENRFYPEVVALLEITKKFEVNLLNLRGSSAGAFGIPQFLPSTFLRYAVDGNSDGKVSLFSREDAVLSTANYLSSSGWEDQAPVQTKEEVIWKYNHSEPYIETVLTVADKLSEE